jgi:hypothetical protein
MKNSGRIRRRGTVLLAAWLLVAALGSTAFGAAGGGAIGAAGGAADKPARKPGVAFLFSLVLPGAGQLYNGDSRGFVYLGLDAASWFARLSYASAGNRRERDSERFADLHWSHAKYKSADGQSDTEHYDYLPSQDSLIVATALTDRSRYYTELARPDRYKYGWDDYRPETGWTRDNWTHFRTMRSQADDLRKTGRLFTAALVLNRVVSAVDALRTARGRQHRDLRSEGLRLDDLRLESGLAGSLRDPRVTLRLAMRMP